MKTPDLNNRIKTVSLLRESKPKAVSSVIESRIIRDDFDLAEYLLLADFDMIAQKFSSFQNEAGIFYIRSPREKSGFIFSITDKKFPVVTGDGKTKLGDLILRDPRARLIAGVYFARHRDKLSSIPENGEIVPLSECGNHCQGAVFLNGEKLKTAALAQRIERIADQIPQFYFGRFDVRYRDQDSLKNGESFEIVEINGAGSEATHIWDANTSLFDAYQTLFRQWDYLFSIGFYVKSQKKSDAKIHIGNFLKECVRVFRRKDPLAISS